MEGRLIELETRLAFQDDTINALNAVVTDQQHQLEQLNRRLKLLEGQFEQLLDVLPGIVPGAGAR